MSYDNAVPPSIRTTIPRWNACIDHEVVYLGVFGPHWFRRHSWICLDESHEQYAPVYHTLDGSGKFNCSNPEVAYNESYALRQCIREMMAAGLPIPQIPAWRPEDEE